MPQSPLEREEYLHEQATRLLSETTLRVTLEKFGNVSIGGSYLYRLMTYPDIDVHLQANTIAHDDYTSLVADLASLAGAHVRKTTDRTDRERDGDRPKGYWIGLEMTFENNTWNLDIWFQQPEWYKDTITEWVEKLKDITPEQKLAILTLKEELRAKGEYGVGKKYQSVDVYRAIIEHRNIS